MGPVYAEIDIDAPRELIFDYLMDVATRRDIFGSSIMDFRLLRLESRGIGAGARFRFKRRKAWVDTAITSVERPRRISERGNGGRLNLSKTGTEWEIVEGAGAMSRIRISYWTEPAGMAKHIDRLTGGSRWYGRLLKRAAAELRERAEAERVATERVEVAGGNRYSTGVR